MIQKIEMVIFDCDGVLVDSEYLASQIGAQIITEAGYPIDAEALSERYAGLIFIDILKKIEEISSIPFSINLVKKMQDEFSRRMPTELKALPDIRQTIENLNKPYCICSNSTYKNIEDMLKLLGLFDLFMGRIFSAPDMGTKKSKPAPDIFLYAAKHMNKSPENCIVIEDSVHGITAARAAHMRVIGFTGGGHSYNGHSDALIEAGAETVINRHNNLIPMLKALEEWSQPC